MNLKKTFPLIIVLLTLAIIGFVAWFSIKKFKEDNLPFGKKFNPVRDSLGLPVIGDDWTLSQSDIYYQWWIAPDTSITQQRPFHQIKSVGFYNDTITDEEDDFYYNTGDSLAYRLILRYRYRDALWDCEIVRIRRLKRKRAEYWPITLKQADSVLATWGLSRRVTPL